MDQRKFALRARFSPVLFGIVIFALALAGCAPPPIGGQTGGSAAQSTSAPAATTAPTAAPAATQAPVQMATSASPASGPATVTVHADSKLGAILVDDKGMTLYLFTKDEKNTSNCYDQCAVNWPPLLTEGAPAAKAEAEGALLSTTTRKDGTTQVTYNGWPLYYYIKDQKPGDVTGQEVGDVWYVVSPSGEMVEGEESATPAAAGTSTSQGKTVSVSIKSFSFGAALTVPVGTTVTWTNEDDAPHTVTATSGGFDSGNMEKGATFSFTFDKAGTFDYICAIHPSMKGQVTVTQ